MLVGIVEILSQLLSCFDFGIYLKFKEKKAIHAQFVAERQAEYVKGQGEDYV